MSAALVVDHGCLGVQHRGWVVPGAVYAVSRVPRAEEGGTDIHGVNLGAVVYDLPENSRIGMVEALRDPRKHRVRQKAPTLNHVSKDLVDSGWW